MIHTREDEGVSFKLEEEYEQALGTATEEELVDLAGKKKTFDFQRQFGDGRDHDQNLG